MMRTRSLVLAALLLVLPLALPGVAAAAVAGTGTLQFLHDTDIAPSGITVAVVPEGAAEEQTLGSVAKGETGTFQLPEGTHALALYNADGAQLLQDYEVTIVAGTTPTLVSAFKLLGHSEPVDEDDDAVGTLVFRHDLDAPASVTVGVLLEGTTEERRLEAVPSNNAQGFPGLPVGTHRLALYGPDGTQLLRDHEFVLEEGQQTSVYSSAVLGVDDEGTGTLRFTNDRAEKVRVTAGAPGASPVWDATLVAGQTAEQELEAGTYEVWAYTVGGSILGKETVEIQDGGTDALAVSDLTPASADDEDTDNDVVPDDVDDEITTPTRVDTGGGGTAISGPFGAAGLVMLVVGAAAIGAWVLWRAP